MFGFGKWIDERRRQKAALKKGEEAGAAMTAAVDDYLDRRLPQVSTNLLNVFRGQLRKIYGDKQHDPKTLAYVEYRIFNENISSFQERLKQDVHDNLPAWIGITKELGLTHLLDQYIDKKARAALTELEEEAILILAEAVVDADRTPYKTITALVDAFKSLSAWELVEQEGHRWLEDFMHDSQHKDAPPQLLNHAAAVRRYLAISDDSKIAKDGYRKFTARFDRYLMENTAPTKELAEVFGEFKKWLRTAYEIADQAGTPITSDLRDWYARVLLINDGYPVIIAPDSPSN